MFWKWLTDKFLTHLWLFNNVFWQFSNNILLDTEKEKVKKILFTVYNLKDVYDVFPWELDEVKLDRTLKTFFQHESRPDPALVNLQREKY